MQLMLKCAIIWPNSVFDKGTNMFPVSERHWKVKLQNSLRSNILYVQKFQMANPKKYLL